MSRPVWAAAVASVLALLLTPGVALAKSGRRAAAAPPSVHAKPTIHSPRRAGVSRRLRHPAARAAKRHAAVTLAPGTGYEQPRGSRQVRTLQRRLAGLGFSPGPIDGRYGPLTTRAVERFQSTRGLPVDGISGLRTLSAVRGSSRAVLASGAGYGQRGGSGRVRALQRRLAGLGFSPGSIDGRYGPLTTRAVERFQSASRLPVDGAMGRPALRLLRTGRHHATPTRQAAGQPAPRVVPAPSVTPTPERGGRGRVPGLPVTPVLLALAALGLAAMGRGYVRTRVRLRAQARARQRSAWQISPRSGSPPRSELIDRGGPAR